MAATLPTGYERTADGRLRTPSILGDADLDAAFWSDGYVKRPGLDATALADLGERFARLRPNDAFDPATVGTERGTYHCTFLDEDRAYRREADQLVRDVFGELLAGLLPGYRILSSNIYVKPPGTGRFEIHQNWPTIEALDVPTLTAWVPLQDTSEANGTIRFVPGSHHVFPDVAAASSDRFFDDFEADLIDRWLQPVDVAAGEVVVFDDSLLHWSDANASTQPRVTFQIELVPVDVPAVLWVRAPEDPEHFELWEIDKEYWIEYPFESVFTGPRDLPLVGRRPNPNRRLSLSEFEAAMARRDDIRRDQYVLAADAAADADPPAPATAAAAGPQPTAWSRRSSAWRSAISSKLRGARS